MHTYIFNRKLKYIIYILILHISYSCKRKHEEKILTPNRPTSIESLETSPYKDMVAEIDSISYRYKRNNDIHLLDSLNHYACISDGDASEEIEAISANLYQDRFTELINYLYNHQGCCLELTLINGIGSNLSTSEPEVRSSTINTMKSNIKTNSKITLRQKAYTLSILNKVNPNRLD